MGFSRQEYWSGVPSPSPMHHYATLNTSVLGHRYPVASNEVKGSNIPREDAPINGPKNGQFMEI